MLKRVLDEILMSLIGDYDTLEDFAQRLEDRLRFEGFKDLEVGVDEEHKAVAILFEGRPLATVFLSGEGPYLFKHDEYCEDPSPVVWNYEAIKLYQGR